MAGYVYRRIFAHLDDHGVAEATDHLVRYALEHVRPPLRFTAQPATCRAISRMTFRLTPTGAGGSPRPLVITDDVMLLLLSLQSQGRRRTRPAETGSDRSMTTQSAVKETKAARKVIITCAVTGSVHTPTMTPYLPITPDQIARESIEAAEAGASVIHLHARDPKDGRPTPNPDVFMQFLPRIKQSCDAVINITTGGSLGMTMEDRLAAPLRAKPELCSLNMGSMNFGIFHITEKIDKWQHEWER